MSFYFYAALYTCFCVDVSIFLGVEKITHNTDVAKNVTAWIIGKEMTLVSARCNV